MGLELSAIASSPLAAWRTADADKNLLEERVKLGNCSSRRNVEDHSLTSTVHTDSADKQD